MEFPLAVELKLLGVAIIVGLVQLLWASAAARGQQDLKWAAGPRDTPMPITGGGGAAGARLLELRRDLPVLRRRRPGLRGGGKAGRTPHGLGRWPLCRRARALCAAVCFRRAAGPDASCGSSPWSVSSWSSWPCSGELMRDGGRLTAAIEVLTEIETRHRPVRLALKNWGEGARYAGSKDRAFISGLVLDVLRRRRSLAWRMGDDSLRAAVLAALHLRWDWPIERLAEAAGDEVHGHRPPDRRRAPGAGGARDLAEAPAPVRGRLSGLAGALADPHLRRGPRRRTGRPGRAGAGRPARQPLKTDPQRALKALTPLDAAAAGPDAQRPAGRGAGRRRSLRRGGDHSAVLQGLVRDPGPGQPDRRRGRRRREGPAGARPVRGRRRQDARARRGHGQHRPDLRL